MGDVYIYANAGFHIRNCAINSDELFEKNPEDNIQKGKPWYSGPMDDRRNVKF